jgi:putative transposase
VPRLVHGRPIQSTNPYDHQRQAERQAALGHAGTTARVERFTAKRTRRITHALPTASTASSALLVAEGLGTLVVGKTPAWKQEAA